MAASLTREHEGVTVPETGAYAFDVGHTTIEFVGRHLMITKVRGRFTDFSGDRDRGIAGRQFGERDCPDDQRGLVGRKA